MELDDERRRTAEDMVLPGSDTPGIAREPDERKPDEPRPNEKMKVTMIAPKMRAINEDRALDRITSSMWGKLLLFFGGPVRESAVRTAA